MLHPASETHCNLFHFAFDLHTHEPMPHDKNPLVLPGLRFLRPFVLNDLPVRTACWSAGG